MKASNLVVIAVAAVVALPSWMVGRAADSSAVGSKNVKHVVLLSIDGMHAVDFYNCTHGIAGANGGDPYCPNLAALGKTGINYVAASSSKPSDSAPGLMALVTGGTPRTTGIYYDVAFDRTLDGPEIGYRHRRYQTERRRGRHRGGHRPEKALTEPGGRLRACLPLELPAHQHNLWRHSCGRRIHGVDRQAPVVCDGGWTRRYWPE